MSRVCKGLLTTLTVVLLAAPTFAQSLDIPVRGAGLSIGDSEYHKGIRLNFRDRNLREVSGLNATIWTPHDPMRGVINGIALGLPATGGRTISGLGIAPVGVGAEESISGIMLAGIGAGAGGDVRGIGIAGVGIGSGGSLSGLMLAGVGAGAGGDVRGLLVAGVGAGAGGDLDGIVISGIGGGAGGSFRGASISGIGAGAGGDLSGIHIAGIGVAAGGDATGILIGGIGAGAGGRITGLAIGGVGVGASEIRAVVLTGFGAGGEDVSGLVVAPGYFTIEEFGTQQGLAVSAFSRIKGTQNGLTIGILNVAHELNGIQVGLLNFARSNRPGLRWLPIFNANFR